MRDAATCGAVALERFEKRFGKVEAVRPMDLTIARGEAFALLGPNGSGKSTVIRAVAGLHRPTAGRILVNGADPWEDQGGGSDVAYLPQRVAMPEHLTSREILEFFAALRGVDVGRVQEMLEFVALGEEADRSVGGFSGGMVQRLGLGVAFLQEVSVYVLDEPTLNLDTTGADRLREKLHELKERGATILFSSHVLQDAAQLADRVGILAAGELVRVENTGAFRARLAEESLVRVLLERPTPQIVRAAESAGARTSEVDGSHFSFRAPAAERLKVIRAIEAAGGSVEGFHAELPDWDALVGQLGRTEVTP